MNSVPPTDPSVASRADLAERLSIDDEQIAVVSVEEVTWPDSSLGCPQPGRMYAASLVAGHRIVLAAGGQVYEYHSGGDRRPVLCAARQMPPE